MSFAENLNYLLKDTSISQYQLALAIGYSQRAISKWINGQAEPSATAILKCAEYFNVSTDFLLGKEDYGFKKNSNNRALHLETVDNSKISNFNTNKFKELRKEKGLTQFELAQKLNIDQTTISKWELNKALPDTTMLLKLANLFNVSTDYLLQRTSYYFPDTISQELKLDEQEQELIDCYRKLSPYLQGLALETVRGWSGEGKDSKEADILSKNKRA
ncbi:MAG: helix-turn-helix transcriptional regulator [Clostridia bacterium]|nr:helix-turn-helix transcriptional regulator [Clostridia bacterium]